MFKSNSIAIPTDRDAMNNFNAGTSTESGASLKHSCKDDLASRQAARPNVEEDTLI